VALSFVVTGLFGEIALSWAQRFAESRAEESSRSRLRMLSAEVASRGVRDAAGWKALFGAGVPLEKGGTLLVLSAEGVRVASWPSDPILPDRMLIASEGWRESAARIRNGSIAVRRGENRVVTSIMLASGWRMLAFAPPDPAVLSSFLRSVFPVALEIVLLSVALAWAVGRDRGRWDWSGGPAGSARTPGRSETLAPTDGNWRPRGVLREDGKEIRAIRTAAVWSAGPRRRRLWRASRTRFAIRSSGSLRPRRPSRRARWQRGGRATGGHPQESDRLARMMEEMLTLQRMPKTGASRCRPAEQARRAAIRSIWPRSADRRRRPVRPRRRPRGPGQLESVFVNLFENAVLSSDASVHIRARAKREDGHAVVEVEDDGPGLASAVRDRLFEPFVTSRAGGTGIGLAVTRQIVLEHGGTIEVNSPPGGPTVFTIRLPAA
jgi:signal transduction histidine kinase